MNYLAGIDIGGTFTDCAVIDGDGAITISKVASTPHDFSVGFFDALDGAAAALDLELGQLLAETDVIAHGTTVATNVVAQERGARVGLLTTAGHRDVLTMMRAAGRVAGLSPDELMHYSAATKPPPIVQNALIEEIVERVDCHGDVVVRIDVERARASVRRLVAAGAETVGISLLWSFLNDGHERRLAELVAEEDPDLFVTTSSELVPRMGEYERTMAVAINCYVAPASRSYLKTIVDRARELGYRRPVLLMECSGGVVPAEQAAEAPVRLIGSGPAGGITGAGFLAAKLRSPNILATDMGGTTFDVAMIIGGEPVRSSTTIERQREYFVPTIDIRSIGAGGGSLARYDEVTETIKVGPESAGADPGPVCYGKGAMMPTVTDADLVLGYLNPDYFLRGRMRLDKDAAHAAMTTLGAHIGADALEVAAGITQIVDFHMADLIRKVTVERGHDPRELVVFAYGGGGPVHGGVYARELGAAKLVVPLGTTASVWSALGVVSSDVLYVYERSATMAAPWGSEVVERHFVLLEEQAREALGRAGFEPNEVVLRRTADVRYQLQIHNVEVPLRPGPVTADSLDRLSADFEKRYETLFGKGTGYSQAGFELSTLRIRATGTTPKPTIVDAGDAPARRAGPELRKPSRPVWWHELGGLRDTAIYDGDRFAVGHAVEGPGVLEMAETTVVVRPGQVAQVDRFGNIVIDLKGV